MLWLLTPGMAAALAAYVYFVLGRHPSQTGWLPLLPALATAAVLPLWLPADLPALRGCVVPPVISLAAKAFELYRGRVHDPSAVASFSRFLTWFFLPADTRWPRSAEDIRLTRRSWPARPATSGVDAGIDSSARSPFATASSRSTAVGDRSSPCRRSS